MKSGFAAPAGMSSWCFAACLLTASTCLAAPVGVRGERGRTDGAVPAAASCRAPRLKQGMPYTAARKTIIDRGFMAPTPPAYGYKESDEKVVSECKGNVELCNKYPEIDACSAQGHCKMIFHDAYGNELDVVTYGELARGRAYVLNFDIECKN